MPLTDFQRAVLDTVRSNRSVDSHLAGGSALHLAPDTPRISNDIDFFHDSAERVRSAYDADASALRAAGFTITEQFAAPTFIRALVQRDAQTATLIDWAFDSAWRFLPVQLDPVGGYVLQPIDLAVNKTLALVGRDEARDWVDILYAHSHILPLGALVWAAPAKDPGFNPRSLLDLLRRRGRPQPEDVTALHLTAPFDQQQAKLSWLAALDEATVFVDARPPAEAGCLYRDARTGGFVMPSADAVVPTDVTVHRGKLGGVLPLPADLMLTPRLEP